MTVPDEHTPSADHLRYHHFAMACLSLAAAAVLPASVPLRFNAHGVATAYGSPLPPLALMPLAALVLSAIFAGLARAEPRRENLILLAPALRNTLDRRRGYRRHRPSLDRLHADLDRARRRADRSDAPGVRPGRRDDRLPAASSADCARIS